MSSIDKRWEQRFASYLNALEKLQQAVDTIRTRYPIDEKGKITDDLFLDDIIKEGLIQRFEYTHELAWKVMRDFLMQKGNIIIYGSKDATREAFAAQLILDGELWMDMIQSRNKTSHTYDENIADEIFRKVMQEYIIAFQEFGDKINSLKGDR